MNRNCVPDAMVSAGLKILRKSGALAYELSSDHLLVRAILEAAIQSQTRVPKTPEMTSGMNDADIYFDGEVAALGQRASQAKADKLAAERKIQRERDERIREQHRRQKFMVSVDEDDDEFCLLDVDAEKLQAALDELGHDGASLSIAEETLRSARIHYLAGRTAQAADVIYPAIREALGVAV